MNDFTKLLKDEMKKQHLSCQQLGKLTSVSTMSISYYRSGKVSPSIKMADKILKILNMSITLGNR